MLLQKKPNPWSCLPTAFAIVIERPVQQIFDYLGHDGGEITNPYLPEPYKRRGFHIQEMIDFCWHIGYSVTPIEFCPCLAVENRPDVIVYPVNGLERIQKYLDSIEGVLTGIDTFNRHALAWDRKDAIDPDTGLKIMLSESLILDTFYMIK